MKDAILQAGKYLRIKKFRRQCAVALSPSAAAQHSSRNFGYLGPRSLVSHSSASQVQCLSLISRRSKNQRENLVHSVRACTKYSLIHSVKCIVTRKVRLQIVTQRNFSKYTTGTCRTQSATCNGDNIAVPFCLFTVNVRQVIHCLLFKVSWKISQIAQDEYFWQR